jgi:hypothetical protein
VHGSTAQQLARMARCPLLVFTRAARETASNEVSENGHQAAVAGSAK